MSECMSEWMNECMLLDNLYVELITHLCICDPGFNPELRLGLCRRSHCSPGVYDRVT